MAPPLSVTPLQCKSALDLYSDAAEFGTVATRPPRRTASVCVSAVGLLKSRMAVPAVEAASSDSEAPVKDVLTATPVMLRSAGLYCKVNLPEVMPLPMLTLSGMPR